MNVKRHMSINLNGLLRNYGKKSLKGFFLKEDGKDCTDKEARGYIAECQSKGYKIIPFGCGEEDCPEFDYLGGGCPGHKVNEEETK